ncbi:MAG: hypothetical protein ACKO23_02825 [Gemmataceae bacterium]
MLRKLLLTLALPLIALGCAPQRIAMEAVSAPVVVWEEPAETKPLPAQQAPVTSSPVEDPSKGKSTEVFQFPRDAAGILLQGVLPPQNPLTKKSSDQEIVLPRPLPPSRLLEVPVALPTETAYAPGRWTSSPRKTRALSTWREEGLDGVGSPGRPIELPRFPVDRPIGEPSTPLELPPALDFLAPTPRAEMSLLEDATPDVSLRQAVIAPLSSRDRPAVPTPEAVPNPYPHRRDAR